MLSQEPRLFPNATGLLKVKFESTQSLIFHLYPVSLRVSMFLNGKEKLGFIENKNQKGSRKRSLHHPPSTFKLPQKDSQLPLSAKSVLS